MEDIMNRLRGLSLNQQDNNISVKEVLDLWKEYSGDNDIVTEIVRALRNFIAGVTPREKKELIYIYPEALDFAKKVLIDYVNVSEKRSDSLIKCTLQFVFNFFQGYDDPWFSGFEPHIKDILRCSGDTKVQNYCSSLVYLALKNNEDISLEDIFPLVIRSCMVYESEFGLLTIKHICSRNGDFDTHFDCLGNYEDRDAVLEVMTSDLCVSIFGALPVARLFKGRIQMFFTFSNSGNSDVKIPETSSEVIKLLEILCNVTSESKILQEDLNLLIDSVNLLKLIHNFGKNDESYFKPIRKISQVSLNENYCNPYFGFKRDLIRLIGNLVYEHKNNQDNVGSMDCVQLLLDCSSIDGRNPFITQWVVFALRNLTQNNPGNQAIIADMGRTGKLDKKLLVESGIILH